MRRHIFDGFECQPRRRDLLHQPPHIGFFPAVIAGQGRVVHLQSRGADLRRKAQAFRAQLMELPNGDPDGHGRYRSNGVTATQRLPMKILPRMHRRRFGVAMRQAAISARSQGEHSDKSALKKSFRLSPQRA